MKHLLFICPLLFCIGFAIYILISYIEYEDQIEYYEKQIAECDRRLEELQEEYLLLNYTGGDWMERWDKQIFEEMMNENRPT